MHPLQQQPHRIKADHRNGIRSNTLLAVPEDEVFYQETPLDYCSAGSYHGYSPFSSQINTREMSFKSTSNFDPHQTSCYFDPVNDRSRIYLNNGAAVEAPPSRRVLSQQPPSFAWAMMHRRRHTLEAVQHNCVAGNACDDGCARSFEHNAMKSSLQDGAISPEEAERKRILFLHYLLHCYPQHVPAMPQRDLNENSPLALIRNRASFVADNSFDHSYGVYNHESDSPKYGSLSRGGRLRSSLPIVRSRSKSRDRPLGIVYLEYSGESRTAVLPNELTSLDTIRALFVQAYPGLLTMPMLNPQRHTLLLKNKKNEGFDEINSISNIKDRSTIRARPTGIPMPGSKKPAVHQKPKINKEKKNNLIKDNKTDESNVAEKNQKNAQKSGLKPPVKSLIRQYQTGSNNAKPPVDASDPVNNRQLAVKKSLKNKAPPPPPRKPKPTHAAPSSNNPLSTPQGVTLNGSLRSGNGLGGGSFSQNGFSYVSTMLNDSSEFLDQESNEQISTHHVVATSKPMDNTTSTFSDGNINNVTPALTNHNEATGSLSNLQPRTYAGSPMAAQTKFSSSSSLPSDQNISKLIKSKGLETRAKSTGQLPKSTTSKSSKPPALIPSKHEANDSTAVQPSSVERKDLIRTSGSASLFHRTNRSFKGNQPKPFSIPTVPDLTNNCPTNQPDIPSGIPLASNAASVEPLSSVASSSDSIGKNELAHNDKSKNQNNNNNNKKSFFGLKKMASNKPAAQSLSAFNKTKPSEQGNAIQTRINDTNAASCSSSSSSINVPQAPKLPTKKGSLHFANGRKATFPKTDLLNSLLSHKAESSNREILNEKDNFSSSNSDTDKDSFQRSSNTPVLTGVLKNSNLVKSTSSSSLLTDSGASNLSATPSMKTKKVSFQDNVTVCDVNGISTFSNSLRHPDYDESVYAAAGFVESQSLSKDETDAGNFSSSYGQLKPWPRVSPDYHVANTDQKTIDNLNMNRMRPATPRAEIAINSSYSVNYTQQYASNNSYPSSNYSAHLPHQSAVAAAIQSISAKPAAAVANDRSAMTQPQSKQGFANYDQFSVSCASPVPFVTRQERNLSSYKEEWDPYRRRSHADAAPTQQGSTQTQARSCYTPSIDNVKKTSSFPENAPETEPTYFQTQKFTSTKDSFHSDTPPYYECCSSVTSTQQQTTDSKPSATSIQKQTTNLTPTNEDKIMLPLSEKTRKFETPPTDAAKVSKIQSTAVESNYDQSGSNRMVAMERKIASLTGMLEAMMTANDKAIATSGGIASSNRNPSIGASELTKAHPEIDSSDLRQQLLKLRSTAHDLKEELKELKKQQRFNMEHINELVNEKSKNVAQFVSQAAGAQHRPLRLRRMRLDQERHTYGVTASLTEKQLSDVEAAVEELRNEVVERRCRVNSREVEALVLQLSQAGRTIAQLKGTFPSLCEELRTVAAAETEVIYAEEKFSEAEPLRLDEQLKRCKQLTATLFTLKKLANVQEARTKTPTSFAQLRPTTPSQLSMPGARDDPNLNRNSLMLDVSKIKVDHRQRMESLQEAEVSWKRRRKFILEHDSKKLEKALEMAEKALNRTDYISQINEHQQAQLKEIYKNRDKKEESNLTSSDSSSIESLPPHPDPKDGNIHQSSSKVPLPSGHSYSYQASAVHLPPSNFKNPKSSVKQGYGAVRNDLGYMNPERVPGTRRIALPPENTGSLPRYANSSAYRLGYGAHPNPGKMHHNVEGYPQHSAKPIERSRSVTPQHWIPSGLEVAHFQGDFQSGHVVSNDERQQAMEQPQHHAYVDKNKKLKEQYSKLQIMQKRQRMSMKKNPAFQNKSYHQHTPVLPGAKSSDV